MKSTWVPITCFALASCSTASPEPAETTLTDTTATGTATTQSTITSTTAGATTTTSPPEPGAGAVVVIGDWGAADDAAERDAQEDIAQAIARFADDNDVEAILTTGDNFYSDDAERIMAPYEWTEAAGIPFWITWGNHDRDTDSRVEAVNEAFGEPKAWRVEQWGDVSFLILDSTQVRNPEQVEFLEATLAEIVGPTVVVFHHPAYSCSRHGDTPAVVDTWLGRFDDDVVLVLSGHDHNYQRIDAQGITYVVSGGGGKRLYEIRPCPHSLAEAQETHHFLVLQQVQGEIWGTAIDSSGRPFDEFFVDTEAGSDSPDD